MFPSFSLLAGPAYQHIIVEKQGAKTNVGVITLNRPKALNALCDALMREVSNAVDDLERDKDIGAVIITGSEKAFAAGSTLKLPITNVHIKRLIT